jgi:hypothetical protein
MTCRRHESPKTAAFALTKRALSAAGARRAASPPPADRSVDARLEPASNIASTDMIARREVLAVACNEQNGNPATINWRRRRASRWASSRRCPAPPAGQSTA